MERMRIDRVEAVMEHFRSFVSKGQEKIIVHFTRDDCCEDIGGKTEGKCAVFLSVTILTLGIGEHINRDEIVRISGKDELAFQDLHRNISLENFVAGFKNLSQGEHCEYARGSDGAQITCGPDFIQVEVSTNHKLKGRLFFEGFHGEPGCSSTDDSSRLDPQHARYDVRIRASHGKCGLVKSHEVQNSTIFRLN
ncbi:hypothetical protein ANCCAN_26174 [Ancylostoma caninum]|uniref:ZP domain-containing protein n=1 Tax=Ancylostoma caninum TaxID=29170 RepID=A0A368FD19_ANCCA|nr:hypothetical protein ANCCAN_26174 [Ancylostoma caninum]